jgi:hypothetical protein
VTDAPDTVEVVLREKEGQYIVHLVNMARGKREIIAGGRRRYPLTSEIPAVPKCHISVRLPAKPQAVHLQPQGIALDGWKFDSGRLEADLPPFEIHQMVVIDIPDQP